MVAAIAWWLILLDIILIILRCIDHSDRRRIAEADRAYQAALTAARALCSPEDRQRPMGNRAGVGDWSRAPRKGPEIAKSEGVHRERGNN